MRLMIKVLSRFGFASATRPQLESTPEDLAAINAVVVEMTEGFNKHDAVAASRVYTSDAEFTNVLGMTAKGAAEIEKFSRQASGLG
jgi:ketosteroid isomerase-like protein